MTATVYPGLEPGGQTITREIPGVGVLKFEDYPAGTWMTKAGRPGKIARRRYLLDDQELDAVSSIVGTLDKPALMRWIEDQATRGAVLAERMGELADVHEDDWMARVKSLNLGASAKRDEGADRGTIVHTALHGLAVDGRPPNPLDLPALARPWLQGAVRAWMALGVTEVIAAEEIIAHPVHLFAGRPDLVARCDGTATLLDWKSSKGGRVWDSAHWQTRLYAMALAAMGIEVERIVIVGIGDDGTYELIDCGVSEQDAEALIRVHRSRKRATAGMVAQRKVAKALAEKAAA